MTDTTRPNPSGSFRATLFEGPSEDYPIIWQCDHLHDTKREANECWRDEAQRRGILPNVEPVVCS